ncbi:MAG: hypothetical protein IPO65_18540 [Saprospiraceae bacterium]|nr:hypothetical protein [Saprospiraceae bacterium]
MDNSTFAYILVLLFLLINRYLVKYYNIIAFKVWDANPLLLKKSNTVVNNVSTQQFIYISIATILFIAQIDKGLYNVFHQEFSEILIPATVTFIAIERALKSIKVE